MIVRSPFYGLAFVLAAALLIGIVGCGAVFAVVYRRRPSGFSYLAGGMVYLVDINRPTREDSKASL
jgi:hypothetical protein